MTQHHSTGAVSRRTALAGLGAGGLGLALTTRGRGAVAQDATPATIAGHPLVGTWYVNIPGPPNTPAPALTAYTADGIATQLDPARSNGMGAWEATGARTGVVTLIFLDYAAGSTTQFESFGVARNLIEVDATGNSFVGQGEIEFRALDGTKIDGPYGPFALDGKRVQVETAFALVTAASSPVATPAP